MNPSRKKNGEKAILLQACGEELFSCEGENKVTQGIYVIRKGRKLECFCKRAVWVPINTTSLETLKKRFQFFDAAWPESLDETPMVGLCGRNATRTAHATDSTFLILSLHAKMKFVAVGIVRVEYGPFIGDAKPDIRITGISSDPTELEECIDWIRKESSVHESTKSVKRPREKALTERVMAGVVSELNAMKRSRISEPERLNLTQVKGNSLLGTETSSDIMPTTPYADDVLLYGFQPHETFDFNYDVPYETFAPPAPIVCDTNGISFTQPILNDVVVTPSQPQDSSSHVLAAHTVPTFDPVFKSESEYITSPEHIAAMDAFPLLGNDSFSFSMFPEYAA